MNRFIAIEGPNGSGKTVQAKKLAGWLEGRGLRVETCRDPGSTKIGEGIRRLLRDDRALRDTQLFLYLAARAQLGQELIGPALERGSWVVSDRYSLSTSVYQGRCIPYNRELLSHDESWFVIPRPSLWIVLDVCFDMLVDRLEARGSWVDTDRLATASIAYEHEESKLKSAGHAVEVIDGDGSVEDVAELVRQAVTKHFNI